MRKKEGDMRERRRSVECKKWRSGEKERKIDREKRKRDKINREEREKNLEESERGKKE